MEVRMMRREDVAAVAEMQVEQLHQGWSRPEPYLNPNAPIDDAKWLAHFRERYGTLLTEPNVRILVATAAGDVPVGFARCEITTATVPGVLTTELPVGCLDLVYVRPAWRRQGVARLLTVEAERVFRELGLEWIELAYWLANGLGSATWPALGFTLLHETVRRSAGAGEAASGEVTVRELAEADLEVAASLYRELAERTKALPDPYCQSEQTEPLSGDACIAKLRELKADPNAQVLIAESHGVIVGFAAGHVECPMAEWMAGVKLAGEVDALYARSDAAGTGAEEALESALAARLGALGAPYVHAVGVLQADPDRASFWRARGYRPFHHVARQSLR